MMSTVCSTRVRVYLHYVIILRVAWLCLSVIRVDDIFATGVGTSGG